jgi:hypothetical protein
MPTPGDTRGAKPIEESTCQTKQVLKPTVEKAKIAGVLIVASLITFILGRGTVFSCSSFSPGFGGFGGSLSVF